MNCKDCTKYHFQFTRAVCEAGVFDVQIAGRADIAISQADCAKYEQLAVPEMPSLADSLIAAQKKPGRPKKGYAP